MVSGEDSFPNFWTAAFSHRGEGEREKLRGEWRREREGENSLTSLLIRTLIPS